MIPNRNKNKNLNKNKVNYLCYDKIKSIPRQNNIQRRNSNKYIDLVNYNNSIEVDKDLLIKVKNKNTAKKSLYFQKELKRLLYQRKKIKIL